MIKFHLLILVIFFGIQTEKKTNLVVGNLFQDNMVIQQDTVAKIWGWGKSKSKIILQTSWGENLLSEINDEGFWNFKIPIPKADNKTHFINLKSENEIIEIKNILIGEVWLASGQSNMEWQMSRVYKQKEKLKEGEDNEITLSKYPKIRMINIEKSLDFKPRKNFKGKWQVCSPETVSEFSAVGYFFAKKLHNDLRVPIGIINSSVGGTPAEAWTDIDFLKKVSGFENLKERLKISLDPNTQYNKWIRTHKIIDRSEFINKDDIKYLDEKNKLFTNADFDDTKWKSINISKINNIFEKKNFDLKIEIQRNKNDDFDGVCWIRQQFIFDCEAEPNMEFNIGEIQDFYSVFINGEMIGRKSNWAKTNSKYKLREGLIKKGVNTIVIRFIDFYGNGGLIEDEKRGFYSKNKKIASLNESWNYKIVGWLTNGNFYKLDYGINEVVFPSKLRISKEQGSPTILNNTMIKPLRDFAIKGVLWYQGEGNRYRADAYKQVFPSVINSFRAQWNNKELPFYYVQLAPYEDLLMKKKYKRELVAELRESQRLTLNMPNVGMAVIMDIGDSLNIHPKIKKPVGERLALLALAKDYGFDKLTYSGPMFNSVNFKKSKALISFDHLGSGLYCSDGNLKHFEIAAENKKFFPAQAIIKNDTVIAWSKNVRKPKYVRYGWKNYLKPNFFNIEGLPASSFRNYE